MYQYLPKGNIFIYFYVNELHFIMNISWNFEAMLL